MLTKTQLKQIVSEELSKFKFRNSLQRISESSLSRILQNHYDIGFIIISANRSCEAERGRECTPAEEKEQEAANIKNEKEIRSEIRNAGFGYIPVWGGFKEKVLDPETGAESFVDNPKQEPSFIVPAKKVGTDKTRSDYEALKELGKSLSVKYHQDSFLYKPPKAVDSAAYFITKTGDIDMKFDDVTVNDLSQIYFTKFRKKKEKTTTRRFSLVAENTFYLAKPPKDLSEARSRFGEVFYRLTLLRG